MGRVMPGRCASLLRHFSSVGFPAPSFARAAVAAGAHEPSAEPWLSSLLGRCSGFAHISQTHGFMVSRGLDQDNRLLSRFVDGCAVLGFRAYAYSVFSQKEEPDIYLCNTTIRALAQTDLARAAIDLFRRVLLQYLRPDTYSFPYVLKAAAHLSEIGVGREIHGQIVRIGHCGDVHVTTALIQMYSICGEIGDASHLFDEMPRRDVIAWNALLAGHVRHGDMERASALFERMPERNVISWTTVVAGYVQSGSPAKAIEVFQRMQLEENVQPDEIALLAALSACARLGALQTGEWIHEYIVRRRLRKIVPLMNALIDMYAKSGNIGKAIEVFEGMTQRSVISWTTVIAGMALHGLGFEAIEMFQRMEKARVPPNDVTFVAILSACSHLGLVAMGRHYFDLMRCRYRIRPRIEHYGCMVDLLGRAGFLREARELVEDMPFEANGAIWGSLLAAAKSHSDAGLGELAMRKLVKLEPHNSGNYSLMSDIYASKGRWDDVGRTRKLMRDHGLKKQAPGGSSVEVGGAVHEFTAGDSSHPRLEIILKTLRGINAHLKMADPSL